MMRNLTRNHLPINHQNPHIQLLRNRMKGNAQISRGKHARHEENSRQVCIVVAGLVRRTTDVRVAYSEGLMFRRCREGEASVETVV